MTNPADHFRPFLTSDVPPALSVPDPWIARSVLQKSVRRSNADLAARAARSLWEIDPAALWKRLLVIAWEDIGIGDLAAVMTATAATSAQWRRSVGHEVVIAVAVARMLAGAAKDRGTESLAGAAINHPDQGQCRRQMTQSTMQERLELVADTTLPLPERAVAAWYASGVDDWRLNRVGRGDLPALLQTYRTMGVPETIVAATAMAIRKVREPILLLLPLLSAYADPEPDRTSDILLPPMTLVGDLPLCSLDIFTRLGKTAISRFAKSNQAVGEALTPLLPSSRWAKAAGYGVFYAEGGLVTPKHTWWGSSTIERLGIEADFLPLGFPAEAIPGFLQVVAAELPDLNSIRKEMLA